MNKFLCRSFSRPSLFCTPPNAISLNVLLEPAMPSAAAAVTFVFRPHMSRSSDAKLMLRLAGAGGFRVRRCSINDPASAVRPLDAFKGISTGLRLAWMHTVAAGEEGDSGYLQNENKDSQGPILEEDKPLKFHTRRRANSTAGVSGLQSFPDLLTVPGVGPRNLRKLVDNGIEGVAELKQLYRNRFCEKSSEKMVEYLQSDVGIIHKTHAESIITFIKDTLDEELKDNGSSSDAKPHKKRITVCVEGNISVGKSTFLQRIANETLELRDLVEVVPEPIDKWQNVGPDHLNILDAFYAEPKRYAYTFQNYVFVTRVMQERESCAGIKPFRLMERSVFSDRMVFVRAVHEAKWMNEMEINIYDSWFDPVVSSLPGLIPDGFIYLRASPDTCYKRMMHRKREEEGGVSLDYLRDIHEKHESWLFPSETGNHGVLKVNQLPLSIDSSLHPAIKDRVFYMEGSHMHPSILKVPALVLDCEPNIDLNRDTEAKQHYARQVAEFFQFVKTKKMVFESPHHPEQGTLWVPDAKNLKDLSLESFTLSSSMSSFLSC
ncbi:hypothetical protein V2J09_004236 [Rumex salicifolius]